MAREYASDTQAVVEIDEPNSADIEGSSTGTPINGTSVALSQSAARIRAFHWYVISIF